MCSSRRSGKRLVLMKCANCQESITEFVGVNGAQWCEFCSLQAVPCHHCLTLLDRYSDSTYEITNRNETIYVEFTCLLGWTMDERFRPIHEAITRIAFTSDAIRDDPPRIQP